MYTYIIVILKSSCHFFICRIQCYTVCTPWNNICVVIIKLIWLYALHEDSKFTSTFFELSNTTWSKLSSVSSTTSLNDITWSTWSMMMLYNYFGILLYTIVRIWIKTYQKIAWKSHSWRNHTALLRSS